MKALAALVGLGVLSVALAADTPKTAYEVEIVKDLAYVNGKDADK
jgi:hypothetical protein